MLKSTDFDATYDPKVTKSKGMQKTPEFDATYDPIVTESKGTVKSRVEARVTIQKIKSLGVLQTETCH